MRQANTSYPQIFKYGHDDKLKVLSFKNYPIKNIAIGLTPTFLKTVAEKRCFANINRLEYIIEGKGLLKFESDTREIKKGMTIFIPKNTAYSIVPEPNSPLKIIWVAYTCNYFDLMVREFYINEGEYLIDSQTEFLSLRQLLEHETPSNLAFVITKILHDILIKLSSIAPHQNTLDELKNKIDSLIYSKGNLNEITNTLGVSKSTLIKHFKKNYGISPYQYLLDKKLQIAKDYLSLTNIPIKTITHMLAFSEEHYFCHIFKKKNGLTPLEFRQQIRSKQ